MKTKKNLILLVALLMNSYFLMAQTSQESLYLIVETMKATAGRSAEYVKAEKDVWKIIHQERLKQGLIRSWYFYEVLSPSGSTATYDYVTVTVIQGWKKVENPWGNMLTGGGAKLLSKEQLEVFNETLKLRNLLNRSVFMRADFVNAAPNSSPTKYQIVNYMKVKQGMWEEYYAMETQLVKPMHMEMMQGGGKAAWGLYSRVMPGGDSQPFDYITVDFFNKWEDIAVEGADFTKTLEKVHPHMSTEYYIKRIEESRHLMNRELWMLQDYVR